jgi:small-conductance mechanosensitive channel|uniref:Mechanosensitive ion channel n=1 Tax=candidate division WOR-3 bacterium TaxID=2052148 RepID=A0A7V5XZ60_UNCW3
MKKIALGIFLILFFIFLAYCLKRYLKRLLAKTFLPNNVINLISNLLFYLILFIGFIYILSYFKVNLTGLIAGLGVTSFVISFAVRDFLSNVVAGIILMVMRPFKIGDQIVIQNFEGIVKSITLRYVIIERKEGDKVLIPTSNTLTSPIVVKSKD